MLHIDKGRLRFRKQVLWMMLAGAVLLRLPSMFPPVIDHDESTYLVVAQGLLQGEWLYVTHLDVKPPGIYLLFALIIALWKHTFAVRLCAALFVGSTGWLLYRAYERKNPDAQEAAVFTGVLYVVAASLHRWQWSANTEIFFNFFTAASLFVLSGNKNQLRLWVFGFIAGLGFIIKYHVVFDFFALWFLVHTPLVQKRKMEFVLSGFKALLGFLIPAGLVVLVYFLSGHVPELYLVAVEIPSRYVHTSTFSAVLEFTGAFVLSFFPLVLLFAGSSVLAFRKAQFTRVFQAFFWLLCSFIAVLFTGKGFLHYWNQALLPLCFFAVSPQLFEMLKLKRLKYMHRSKLLLLLIIPVHQFWDLNRKDYYIKEICQEIQLDLPVDARIFVDYKNVIYFETGTMPISRYVHTTLKHDADHIRAFGIDPKEEYRKIIEAQPLWLVLYNEGHDLIQNEVHLNYTAVQHYPNGVVLWKRK